MIMGTFGVRSLQKVFLVVFGMMMTSLYSTYWETPLAQGLVVRLGNGCLIIVSVVVLPTYFAEMAGFGDRENYYW